MGGKTATTTQTVSIPPEVMARYNAVNARAEDVASQPFKPYSNDPSAFVAPLTPTQQAGIAGTNVAAGAAQPYYGAATGLTMAGAQDVGPLTKGQIAYYQDPAMLATLAPTQAALRQQQGQQLAQQQAEAIRSGAFGGERAGLQRAQLMGQQQLGMGQALAPIYQQAYQTGLQTAAQQQGVIAQDLARRMQAGQQIAGLGTGAQAAALQGAQAQLAAGQVGQQTEQAGKQALYNQFLQQQGYPFQVAQFLANIAMGTGALSGSTTTTQQPTGFFSDERDKTNVQYLGDGQYAYDYKDDVRRAKEEGHPMPPKRVGPMAQDIEAVEPGLVVNVHGHKVVRNPDSEGGAVHPGHAGLGFALGGSASFDQDLVKQILANQAGMYAGMYGQTGTPRGAQGVPGLGGGAGRVPAASLPVGRLATAGAAPKALESGLSQAASTGKNIADVLEMGSKAKPYIFGGQDSKGVRVPSIAERVRGWGAPEQGPGTADVGGAPIGAPKKTVEAEGMTPDATQVVGKVDLEDVDKDIFAATGGRIHREAGGETDETAPEGLYAPAGAGINIPDERNKYELKTAANPSGGGSSQSGLGQLASAAGSIYGIGKAASTIMDFLPFIFAKDGGRIDSSRQHFRAGGLSEAVLNNVGEGSKGLDPGFNIPALTDEDIGLGEKKPDAGLKVAQAKPTGLTEEIRTSEPAANFDASLSRVFKEEGGLNKRDSNGFPSLYGINAKHHPDFFKDPSKENAAKIYKQDYWDALGADNLPAPLAHVAFDTAVISGVNQAKKFLEQSGGDPNKYLALRKQFQDDLIARDPKKYGAYQKAWDNRINNLSNDLVAFGEGKTPSIAEPKPAPTRTIEEGRGAAAPGLGGPSRGSMDPYAAPFYNTIGKLLPDDASDAMKSENFWVPMIAGIGSMLASNRPTLGGAIGEGLVGGTAAYMQQAKQQADIDKTRADTERVFSDIVDNSFRTFNGITYIRYRRPDGSYDWMMYGDYLSADPKDRPPVDPRIERVIQTLSERGVSAPGTPGAAKGVVEAGAGAGTATKPATGTTPAVGGQKPPAPSTTAPPAPTIKTVAVGETGVPESVGLTQDHVSQAQQAAKKYTYAGEKEMGAATAPANDYFNLQQGRATGARNQMQQLVPLTGAFAALPKDKSIATSGRLQEFVQPIIGNLQNLAAMAGKPDLVINPEILTKQAEVDKLVNQLQQGRLDASQLRAVEAFKAMANGIPTLTNTPGAQAALMAQLLTQAKREIDKDRFFSEWKDAATGGKPGYVSFAAMTGREANRAFDDTYSEAYYARDRKNLERMFTDRIEGMKSPSTGQDMTVAEFLATNGAKITPKQKQAIIEEYKSPGILEYFGLPR